MKKLLFYLFAFLLLVISSEALAIDYFWVGGTGNWSDFASHWATASGGSTFHTVAPTQNDNVYFDVNSFPSAGATVTVNVAANCADMNWTGAANNPAFAGTTAQNIYIYGSLTLISGMNFSYLGNVYFSSLSTGKSITSAGQTFKRNVYFNGIGGWIIQDAFVQTGAYNVYHNYGTLDMNDQAFTANIFNTNNTNVRTLYLRTSVITLTSTSNAAFDFRGENLTLNAGTSLIRFTAASSGLRHYNGYGPGQAFYDVIFEAATGTCAFSNYTGSAHAITFNSAGSITGGMTVTTLTFTGAGTISSNGNNITTGILNSGGSVNGNGTYGQLTLGGNTNITGNNTIANLLLSAGNTYNFTSGRTQLISGSFTANGTCTQPINLQSSSAGSQTSISKSSGTVTIDYCTLIDINASGGATFIANNTIDFGNNTGWTINPPSPQNLFWVGGTGNWNDPAHWSFTSGGPGGTCVPTSIDNVFFDANSFSASGQTVTLIGDGNGNVSCNNMNWSGTSNNPVLAGASSVNLNIYGNLTLNPGINFTYAGTITFKAITIGKTIFTGGLLLDNNHMYFQGIGGGWTLQDGLELGSRTLYLENGSLNTSGYPVNAGLINTNYTSARELILGSSVITLNSTSSAAFYFRGENFNFNAGTSLLKFTAAGSGITHYSGFGPGMSFYNILFEAATSTASVSNYGGSVNELTFNSAGTITGGMTINNLTVAGTGTINTNGNNITTAVFNAAATINGNGTYNHVTINGNGSITGNNTFGTLVFSAGKQYTLTNGKTQILTNALSANGTATQLIVIKSSTVGSQSTFSKASGTVTVNYVSLQDNNATGGATFIANNSIDLGNNTGWTINSSGGVDYYWVGGTGNWNDPAEWSLTSGGAGGAGVPTVLDDVFFDANSFSAPGQTVTIIGDASNNARVLNMDWTGVTNNPTLAGASTVNLSIHGSLTMSPLVIYNFSGPVYFNAEASGQTIFSAGLLFDNNDMYFQGTNGGWTLQDALNLGSRILYLVEGTLNTNNQTINAGAFQSNYTTARSCILGSSMLNLSSSSNTFYYRGDNFTFDAGTSVIHFTSTSANLTHYSYLGPGLTFHDLVFDAVTGTGYISNAGSTFNKITFNSAASMSGGNTVDSLIVTGTATISTNGNNINTSLFNSSVTLNNNGTYGYVFMNGNGSITGNNTFGTLVFTTGNQYTLTAGKTQTITGDLIANGAPTQLIIIKSSSAGSQSSFSKASGSVSVNYVSLQDNNATGGATFIANNSIDLGNNTGWIINSAGGINYYWVGGTGNWNDPAEWSLTSGGTGGAGVPTTNDNVYFDANSFSAPGQVVTVIGDVSNNARVKDMDWTGAANNPTLAGASTQNLRISGSFKLIPGMTFNFAGLIYFEATETGKTITCAGIPLDNNDLYFNGEGGEWTLLDPLDLGPQTLFLVKGSLITNNLPVAAEDLNTNFTSTRSISLGSSLVTLSSTSSCIVFRGENLTFNAGTSLIQATGSTAGINHVGPSGPGINFYNMTFSALTGSSSIENYGGSFNKLVCNSAANLYGGNTIDSLIIQGTASINTNGNSIANADFLGSVTINNNGTYGNISLKGNGSISGNNTFDNIELSPGFTYTLTNSRTQIINGNLIAEGSCALPIIIQSNSSTVQTTLSKPSGNITINHVSLQGLNATGGAVFMANNAIDMGNNTGWTINASGIQNLYWVGGTGNWDDINHWAASSGGSGGYCVPTLTDNVIFDNNSFTQTGQAIYINVANAYCRNMDWSAATFEPTFTTLSNIYNLRIYGGLTLCSGMNFAFSGPVWFEAESGAKASHAITMSGKNFSNDVYFNGNGGDWALMDAFNAGNNDIRFNFGTLNSNGQTVSCRRFLSDNNNLRTLNMGASVFNISYNAYQAWMTGGSNITINPGTAEIRFTNTNSGFYSIGPALVHFPSITFVNPGGTSMVNSDDIVDLVVFNPAGIIQGGGQFNDVTFYGSGEINSNNYFGHAYFLNNGTIYGNNTFGTISMTPGKLYRFESNKTQTINDLFDAWGNNCEGITIQSTISGTQATISKSTGVVEGNYIDIRDMAGTGGAAFKLYNSVNQGNNSGWAFLDPPGDIYNVKVWLQGPFNGSGMNTNLTTMIPQTQPYSAAPWNYPYCEHFSGIAPSNVVDWILVELRDAPTAATATSATVVDRQAALLLNNGTLIRPNTINPVIFNVTPVYNLYLVIKHRNHLGIMSSVPLVKTGGSYNYDFTTGSAQVYGGANGHIQLVPGVWGMIAADGNADNQVNNTDKNLVWKVQSGSSGYKSGDFNLDGQVNNVDKTVVWKPNTGRGGQVPQ